MFRVLVIDDDQGTRDLIRYTLEAAGYAVVHARNGRIGLETFRAEPADLIITDIIMPESDGVEVLMAIRAEAPDVPVIAISGTSQNSPFYLRLAGKLGASQTLAKPFTSEALLQAVDLARAAIRPSDAAQP